MSKVSCAKPRVIWLMTIETLPGIPEVAPATRNRRPCGQHPKKAEQATELVIKKLPDYIEAHEIYALLRAAPNPGGGY